MDHTAQSYVVVVSDKTPRHTAQVLSVQMAWSEGIMTLWLNRFNDCRS